MRPYWVLLSARYRMLLQYRAAAVAGAGTQFFWGFILIMVLEAFYRSSTKEPPLPFPAAVSYIWLGQALLAMLPWNHDRELEAMVREGTVAYELVRPVDLYGFWYARTLAMRLAPASLRALPIVIFAGFVLPHTELARWSLLPPPSAAAAAAFAAALLAALLLSAAITMLVHVSLLWTLSGQGMARVMPGLVILLSGMVIPLPLFPDWAQPVLTALPFRGLCDAPYRIYSGDIPVGEAAGAVALSLGWTIVLVLLGRGVLARGFRRLVVQGG